MWFTRMSQANSGCGHVEPGIREACDETRDITPRAPSHDRVTGPHGRTRAVPTRLRILNYRGVAILTVALGLCTLIWNGQRASGQTRAPAVTGLRLYVFPLGNIPVNDAKGMFAEPLEVARGGCCVVVGHLIVHPRGTMMWDTGVVPDAQMGSGAPGADRAGKRSLKEQLAEIGYSAKDITYLALSHFHFDHTANANDFQN